MKTSLFLLGLALGALPILAHHSFSAEYDDTKPVKVSGVVTKVEWMNPHVFVYVEVKEDGKTANWACETAGPNTLERQGWSRTTLRIGDRVTVMGYRARDGAYVASAREVVLADGRKVFVGSPYDGAPKQ